jgi:hypothetical protein
MNGWYLMHRGWMTSPDFQREPFSEREGFLWSIEQAAFEPHLQWFNGVQYAVDRGEFITSVRTMAAAFQWGPKRVRGFTARMERVGKWTQREAQQGAHGPTVLTICNYERFQTPAKAKGTAADTPDGTARTQLGHSEGTQQKEGINNSNEGERIEEANASRSLAPALPFGDAIEAWSQIAAIKGWKALKPDLTEKRRKGLGKILSAHGLPGWTAALQRAVVSELLGGPDPPAWFNFEFVCNPNNFTKLNEGNYDRSFSTDRSKEQQPNKWLAANAALSGAPASL